MISSASDRYKGAVSFLQNISYISHASFGLQCRSPADLRAAIKEVSMANFSKEQAPKAQRVSANHGVSPPRTNQPLVLPAVTA